MNFRNTNSWHWLLMALLLCQIVAGLFCYFVWTKTPEKNDPELVAKLQAMESRLNDLQLLHEQDATVLEHQAAQIMERVNAYEAAAREKVGQPIPEGEQWVLTLSNEIKSALLKHELRIIEQEQEEVRKVDAPSVSDPAAARGRPEVAQALAQAAAQAEAKKAEQSEQGLPFNTREIHYVVEGDYEQMFMFLVRQSHLKPSYHFKDIKILPAQQSGMRMEFTLQIHFT
ncbi:MAG: hypothetical protein AAF585_03805 [Verrucomicrobiota bacterium]